MNMNDTIFLTPEQYAAYLQRRMQSDIKNALTLAYCGYKADKAKADKAKAGKAVTNSTNSTKADANRSRKPTSAPAAVQYSKPEQFRDIERRYYQMMEQSAERRRKATEEARKKYECVYPFDVSPGLTIDEMNLYTEYCLALGNEAKQINAERAARNYQNNRKKG